MKYLGLDLGSKTLGIATSDALGMIASSNGTLRHDGNYDKLIDEIAIIVKEKKIDEIVLGLPKNMDGSLGEKALLSQDFAKKIEDRLSLKVHLIDERLSTREAQRMLIAGDASRAKRKQVIDGVAATIILQSYLDRK